MQRQFGCFISAGSVLEGRPEWIVPDEFLCRAADHIARTGQPYLAHRDDDYRITIIARPVSCGRFEMRGTDVLVRARPSWRQLYAERYASRVSPQEFRARFRFAEEEWDAKPESAAADALVLGGWRRSAESGGSVCPLGGLEIPRFRSTGDVPDPGRLYRLDEAERASGPIVVASSALTLSCLQYWLDELGAGSRIQVAERSGS
jgi:hypothetical protein